MAGTLVLDTLRNGAGTASTSADNVIRGCAKAWVQFNGTNANIGASYNVSSVTRNSTGFYTVTFTNAMGDANYASPLSVASGNAVGAGQIVGSSKTATNFQLYSYTLGGSFADSVDYTVAIFD